MSDEDKPRKIPVVGELGPDGEVRMYDRKAERKPPKAPRKKEKPPA